MEFRDKCAVVTGGGHGIGRALAERLAAEGARVVVADIHPERTKKVADRIGGTPFVGNLGERAAVTALVEAAVSAYGPIDIFCSNAGIGDLGPDLASTKEQLDTIVQINLMAHIWAAQDVVPSMVERGGGHLVQTISSASLITGPSGLGYTVTKHGALGFAEWMALNYAHLGIKVTCLCPNAVNTGMLGRNEDAEAGVPASQSLLPLWTTARISEQVPLVPHLLPQAGARRGDPRCNEVELVIEQDLETRELA